MAQNTAIVGGNVGGNIGSCKTESVKVVSNRPSVFHQEVVSITTNSCNGVVEKYNSWEFTGMSVFGLVVVGVVLMMIFITWLDN